MEYVEYQFSSCLLLLLTGIVLGGLFDFYRVFRGTVKAKRWLTVSGDLLFWVLASVIILPLLYWSTWLELRFYVWLAVLIGLVGYFLLFSRIFIPLLMRFWASVIWLPRQLQRSLQIFNLFGHMLFRKVKRHRKR